MRISDWSSDVGASDLLATLDNRRIALAGVGDAMDRDEDLLLLYLTMHGTEDHELAVTFPPLLEEWITPPQLRAALDDAGIRNRVVVISRSEEHTSELQSLMRISYAVFCLKKNTT